MSPGEDINREYFVPLIEAAKKSIFLFCLDFHIDLAKHTAPRLPAAETDPALRRRQAWLCSDKDMLNSASHYLHFFLLASRKLKGMQINTGLCEWVVMSRNNEV